MIDTRPMQDTNQTSLCDRLHVGTIGATAMCVLVCRGALLCAALLVPLTTAEAADLPAPPALPAQVPAVVPPPSRQLECYAGVIGEAVISNPHFDNVPTPGATLDSTSVGGRGGGVGGCDLVFAHTYLGMDATAVYGWTRNTNIIPITGHSFTVNTPFEAALRVRFGYMFDPQFSVYVAGGPSVGYTTTSESAGLSDVGFNWGGQLAAGIEYRFTPDWRIRTEYAFTWPGSDSIGMTGVPLARLNPIEHLARVAIIRRF